MTAADASCPFCRLVAGAASRYVVYRSSTVIATLAAYRVRPGHVRIIPREHVTSIAALSPQAIDGTETAALTLSPALCKLYGAGRSAWSFAQDGALHIHANVLPLVTPSDIVALDALRRACSQSEERVDQPQLLSSVQLIRQMLTGLIRSASSVHLDC